MIYEVQCKQRFMNGAYISTIFTDLDKAYEEAAKQARNYDEVLVYEYTLTDGRYYVTRSLAHYGEDIEDLM